MKTKQTQKKGQDATPTSELSFCEELTAEEIQAVSGGAAVTAEADLNIRRLKIQAALIALGKISGRADNGDLGGDIEYDVDGRRITPGITIK
ncbi:hypothetical protein [Nostoc sp.]|uniref:hypothetical protein n=1 Tax=Nostoc sp. TaxID=1180 RepID=UPI002FFACF76